MRQTRDENREGRTSASAFAGTRSRRDGKRNKAIGIAPMRKILQKLFFFPTFRYSSKLTIPRKMAIFCVQLQVLKNRTWKDYLELEKPLRCFNRVRVCLFPPRAPGSAPGTDVQGRGSSSALPGQSASRGQPGRRTDSSRGGGEAQNAELQPPTRMGTFPNGNVRRGFFFPATKFLLEN